MKRKMVEFYSSWVKGLVDDDEALNILKSSGLIAGVETPDEKEHRRFQSKGLKISYHNPPKWLRLDLTRKDLMKQLGRVENSHIFQSINNSDCRTVGFHASHGMYYYLENHVLHRQDLDYRIPAVLTKVDLTKTIIDNLLALEKKINAGLSDDKRKFIIFEMLGHYDYGRMGEFKKLPRIEQAKLKKIEDAADYLTSVNFIRKVFGNPKIKDNKNIGLLLDVSHIIVSANTRLLKHETKVAIKKQAEAIIRAAKGRIYQLHMNVVKKEGDVLMDAHQRFMPGEPLSEMVLGIAKEAIMNNPGIFALTLEIDNEKEPLRHAMMIVEQAQLVRKELNI